MTQNCSGLIARRKASTRSWSTAQSSARLKLSSSGRTSSGRSNRSLGAALGVDLDPAARTEGVAEHLPVNRERLAVRVSELAQQTGRAFDIGEEQRHRPGRKIAHGAIMRLMRVYVTGASGFVGSHVARALREHGHDVRDRWVDLLDAPRLRRIVEDCDAVVHVAALYSFTAPARELEAVNVRGTRNVIEACRAGRVARLLATSSCATCGPVPGRQATEEDLPPDWELAVPYKRTKLEAERLVLAAGGTCVNPTTPVGDGDRAPTPTGAMIRGIAAGRFRAYPRIGLNVVDVRDVAVGHVLALEHGRPGERYLLGGVDLTLRELFAAAAALAGRPRPRIAVPYTAIRAGAALGLVNRNEAILARTPAYFSWSKAARELGYRPGPVEPALARAVRELSAS
jgi:dihydroflavonol-4-reductase